nr:MULTISPECIES: energy transducer TonB [Acinetobacter]
MPSAAAPVQSAPTQLAQSVKAKPASNQPAKARPEPSPQPKVASSPAVTDHTSTTMQTTAAVTHESPPAPAKPAATTQPAPSASKPIVAENTQPPPVFDEKNYKPISKVKPDYPMRALENELEGNCTVEYSVNTQGQVVNPKALSDCDPIFVRPSLNAARQFKYQPRIVNGQAVEVAKIKNTFEYRIE